MRNFVVNMQKATAEAQRTVAVLSPDYLAARYTQPEWAAAFAQDPTGEKGTLLPIRVRACDINGLWSQIVYIDLVGRTETQARENLLTKVRSGRAKPVTPRRFPGAPPPNFPGPIQVPVSTQPLGEESIPYQSSATGSSRPNPSGYDKNDNDKVQGERTMAGSSKLSDNRPVSIGGHVSGSVIQIGDHNTATVHYRQVTLPAAATVNMRAELTALRELLTQLETPDRRKILNALEDAEIELNKRQPDKAEVGGALTRALNQTIQD